jgi:hypothetical protein
VLDAVSPTMNLTTELDFSVDMPDGSQKSLLDALDPAIASVKPTLPPDLSLKNKFELLNHVHKGHPKNATGRTGRFLEDNFYPHVEPDWAPRPNLTLEATP